jgi:hypothetical protein
MPFEDILTPRKQHGPKCKTCIIIAALEPGLREEVRAAILSGRYGDEELANGLSKVGEPVSKTSMRKHRLGSHS